MHLDVENMQDQNSIQSDGSQNMSPLQKIGQLIKEARERKEMSIGDLAGSLRIGEEQLTAIENGKEELLPEKVFIKAMVRRVAERLNLDLSSLISEFGTESILNEIPPKIQTKGLEEFQYFKKVPTWALITGIIAITTSGFAITYISNNPNQSIPGGHGPSKKLAPKTKAIDSSYHIVAPGQTLSTISRFHEIPLKTLIQINNLSNPDRIKVGTKISLKIDRNGKYRSNNAN